MIKLSLITDVYHFRLFNVIKYKVLSTPVIGFSDLIVPTYPEH